MVALDMFLEKICIKKVNRSVLTEQCDHIIHGQVPVSGERWDILYESVQNKNNNNNSYSLAFATVPWITGSPLYLAGLIRQRQGQWELKDREERSGEREVIY